MHIYSFSITVSRAIAGFAIFVRYLLALYGVIVRSWEEPVSLTLVNFLEVGRVAVARIKLAIYMAWTKLNSHCCIDPPYTYYLTLASAGRRVEVECSTPTSVTRKSHVVRSLAIW